MIKLLRKLPTIAWLSDFANAQSKEQNMSLAPPRRSDTLPTQSVSAIHFDVKWEGAQSLICQSNQRHSRIRNGGLDN